MSELGFRIVRTPYAPQSRLTGTVVQKIRDDGRVGVAVGDEERLWIAWQEAVAELRDALARLRDELNRRLAVEKELAELRSQIEGKGGKKR